MTFCTHVLPWLYHAHACCGYVQIVQNSRSKTKAKAINNIQKHISTCNNKMVQDGVAYGCANMYVCRVVFYKLSLNLIPNACFWSLLLSNMPRYAKFYLSALSVLGHSSDTFGHSSGPTFSILRALHGTAPGLRCQSFLLRRGGSMCFPRCWTSFMTKKSMYNNGRLWKLLVFLCVSDDVCRWCKSWFNMERMWTYAILVATPQQISSVRGRKGVSARELGCAFGLPFFNPVLRNLIVLHFTWIN